MISSVHRECSGVTSNCCCSCIYLFWTCAGTAATVTFVLVDFVYLVRELILEVLSEFVLAAPPQYSANRSIRKQHQKIGLRYWPLWRFVRWIYILVGQTVFDEIMSWCITSETQNARYIMKLFVTGKMIPHLGNDVGFFSEMWFLIWDCFFSVFDVCCFSGVLLRLRYWPLRDMRMFLRSNWDPTSVHPIMQWVISRKMARS